MKGYKALDKDMRAVYGNGMQFELEKWYTVAGDVVPDGNGFYFCRNIEHLNYSYNIKDSRIFEIETYGNIIIDHQTYVTNNIYFKRELSKEEIKDYFEQNKQSLIYNENWQIRVAAAEQGCGLNILLHDKNYNVRRAVAEQGYGLVVLVHDEDWRVRRTVAQQGFCLMRLVHDENWHVRLAVARQGYGLDVLIHDDDYDVRAAVARQGYGLDVLIHDENWYVRSTVARQGHGLDILLHDEDYYVRETAKEMGARSKANDAGQ